MSLFSRLLRRNLIPTARVDKNGRVVIRHMKPEEVGVGAQKTLPAPVPTPSPPTRELVVKTIKFLADAVELDSYDYAEGVQRMDRNMDKLSPKTLERILALEQADTGHHSSPIYHEFYKAEVNETYINDLAMLSNFTDEISDPDAGESAYIIRGFGTYETLPPIGFDGTYPEDRYDKCAALFSVTRKFGRLIEEGTLDKDVLTTHYVSDHSDRATFLADQEVAELLIGSSELDREKITDLLVERGSLSAADLKGLLAGSAASALSDGAL